MQFDFTQLFQTLLHIDQIIAAANAPQGGAIYLILFAIIFCEIGFLPLFFLPGDPLLFVCGAFCAAGLLDIGILIPLLLVATVAGSVVNYFSGRALGRKLTLRGSPILQRAAFVRTRQFYQARGQQTFLVSPYIAVVRTFAPFIGGLSGMAFRPFFSAVCGGAVLWVGGLVVAGYFFGNVPWVRLHIGSITVFGLAVAMAVLLIGRVVHWLRHKGHSTPR